MSGPEFLHPQLARHARYRWDARRKQHQLLFPEGMLVLNETAAAIVRLCDGRSWQELIDQLDPQFPSGCPTHEVVAFLRRLAQRGLLIDGSSS